ncbi:hypothetical protein [Streptomyces kunmingensis]|uniref:hypothetical protein n=1 Tax=Streptomyces kunmingensis TaxID=68225 RepID=UPI0031E36F5E
MQRPRRRFPVRWAGSGVLVVEVPGPFDDEAAAELCSLLARMATTGQHSFVVDFRAAEQCLADGAHRFVEGSRAITADGGVLAFVAGPAGRAALRAAGADSLSVDVHDAVAAAVEASWGQARDADSASGPTPAQDSI